MTLARRAALSLLGDQRRVLEKRKQRDLRNYFKQGKSVEDRRTGQRFQVGCVTKASVTLVNGSMRSNYALDQAVRVFKPC